jgi:16S rRNA (uracil1498-N3)-methyltransferase
MRQLIIEKGKEKNGLINLDGKDYRYLRQVLRVRNGDMISVRLPDGSLKNATVAKIDEAARCVTLQICADTASGADKSITRGVQADEITGGAVNGAQEVEYWLFQFLPRPQKFELIVRQATECGLAVIIPVVGEYTEKSSAQALMGAKRERLERIVREARQQSGSPVDTKVMEPMSLEKAIELWNTENTVAERSRSERDVAFVLSERGDCDGNLRKTVEGVPSIAIKRAAIAVGSEGGISPEEVKTLEEKGLFVPIHFAVNILRCETAALYGIAAVQNEINESK